MTNPKHTDTSRSGDLMERFNKFLNEWGKSRQYGDVIYGLHVGTDREVELTATSIRQAADRIEFLSERADALALQADEWEGKYQIVSEMSERLREAGKNLNWYAGHTEECGNGTWSEPIECDCGYTDAWKQWGAALGDTK